MYEKLSFQNFFTSIQDNINENYNENILKDIINEEVKKYFPNLINEDIYVLQVLTINLVYFIIEKFFDIDKFGEETYKKNIIKQT